MESAIFGILDRNSSHIDVSKTLQGAKNYATRNGYEIVSYRIGYNVFTVCNKVGNKWVNHSKN